MRCTSIVRVEIPGSSLISMLVLLCLMKTARFMEIGFRVRAGRVWKRHWRVESERVQVKAKLYLFLYRICKYLQMKTQRPH